MKTKRILALFPSNVELLREDILNNKAPKERLYGFIEIECMAGYEVKYANYRHKGWVSKILRKVNSYGLNIIHPRVVADIFSVDMVVIKDYPSLSASIACAIARVPLVYYDALFPFPKNKLKNTLLKYALRLSTRIIGYSPPQADEYSRTYSIPREQFLTVDFALDPDFYKTEEHVEEGDYILSVGRDPGRDFSTLVTAARSIRLPVKLVTLPYLTKDKFEPGDDIEIHQYLSYQELFQLYKKARIVVIPLYKDLVYPSGIRAVLESIALRKKVIISATNYVKENLRESQAVMFTKPEDPSDLAARLSDYTLNTQEDVFDHQLPDYSENIGTVINDIIYVLRK